jgi:hypothetical protein
VYRIEPYSLDELEAAAARLATRVAGHKEDSKSHILRGKGRSDLLLGETAFARVPITPPARSRSRQAWRQWNT